ncbi:hypothetical protein V6N13_111531 [Hibiscus sabdariffa]
MGPSKHDIIRTLKQATKRACTTLWQNMGQERTGLAAFIATGKSTQVRQGKRLLGLRKWQQEVNCPLSKSKFLITQLKIDDGHRLGEAKETIRILGNNVLGLDWLPEPVSERQTPPETA